MEGIAEIFMRSEHFNFSNIYDGTSGLNVGDMRRLRYRSVFHMQYMLFFHQFEYVGEQPSALVLRVILALVP
ncbi:Methionine synthase [Dirofilaria immitis]